MSRGNKGNKQHQNGSGGNKASGSSDEPRKHEDRTTFKIPNPLPVQVQPTSADNERYADEENYRHRQAELARKLNWITAIYSGITFAGVILSVMIAIYSVILSERGRRDDERAWVIATEARFTEMPIQPGKPAMIHLEFKNTGKTPALHVQFHGNLFRFTGQACTGIPQFKSAYRSDMPLGPGEVMSNNNYGLKVPDACFFALSEGQATFNISGLITYEDIFGKHHSSSFCEQLDAMTTQLLTACPEGNEVN